MESKRPGPALQAVPLNLHKIGAWGSVSEDLYASGKGTVRTQANDAPVLASPELATLVHPNFDPLRPPILTNIGPDTDSEYITLQKLGRQSFKREE